MRAAAERLGIAGQAVSTRERRAREQLRALLEDGR
jgi:DNA-directed RNA polymerase specialized sigma24 family protein